MSVLKGFNHAPSRRIRQLSEIHVMTHRSRFRAFLAACIVFLSVVLPLRVNVGSFPMPFESFEAHPGDFRIT